MAFNVTNISKYTDEISSELILKTIMTGKTVDLVTVQPGVKYKQTLNILENTIDVQAATCGWNEGSGEVNFKQREIEVTPLEIKDELCFKTLEQYYLGATMKPGAPADVELGAILAESYLQRVQKDIELNLWKGGMGTPEYGSIDGFVKIIGEDSDRVEVTGIDGSFTANDIITAVNKMVKNIPEDALEKEDLTLFLSYANYNLYTAALRTANMFHYDGANGVNYETSVPGTNVKVIGTLGLTGTDYLVLTPASNLVVGTDLANEEEKFDIFYSRDNDEVRVNIQWKIGAQVYFPEWAVANFQENLRKKINFN